jgi:hypothetical protein
VRHPHLVQIPFKCRGMVISDEENSPSKQNFYSELIDSKLRISIFIIFYLISKKKRCKTPKFNLKYSERSTDEVDKFETNHERLASLNDIAGFGELGEKLGGDNLVETKEMAQDYVANLANFNKY